LAINGGKGTEGPRPKEGAHARRVQLTRVLTSEGREGPPREERGRKRCIRNAQYQVERADWGRQDWVEVFILE